jgi:aminoglycoside phosphotransferase (APT) family kinase protein
MDHKDFASRIEEVLRSRVPEFGVRHLISLRRLAGGLSFETYVVDTETASGPRRLILRREPAGGPLAPYDVAFEANIYRALQDTGVPVPRVFHLETDPDVLGRPFVISEFVEGEARGLAQSRFDDPNTRERTLNAFVDMLARIHAVPVGGLPRGPGGAGTGARAEVRLWRKRFEEVELSPRPIVRHVFDVLDDYAPQCGAMVLVHGDYRLSNLLWHRDDRIAAVLDWERSFIGDPMADIAFTRDKVLAGWCAINGAAAKRYTARTGIEIDETAVIFWQLVELVKGCFVGMSSAACLARGASSDLRLVSVATTAAAIEPALPKLVNLLVASAKG